MSKVLITGVSGFLGEALCRRLIEESNIEVTGIDLVYPPQDLLKHIDFVKGDIRNLSFMKFIYKNYNFDIIFHCAALVPISRVSYREFMKTNCWGTLLVHALYPKRFIHISSSAVYGIPKGEIKEDTSYNPVEDYGTSKMYGDYVCKGARDIEGTNVIIVRPRTIIGEGRGGMMDLLFSRVSNNKYMPIIGDGNNRFQLLSLRDCIDFLMLVYHNEDIVNEDFNIGTDKYTTLAQDITDFIKIIGSSSKVKKMPKSTRHILRTLDKLGLSPMTPWHYETIDKDFYFDITKAKSIGWSPKDSNVDMLVRSYNWYRDNMKDTFTTLHRSKLKKRLLNII